MKKQEKCIKIQNQEEKVSRNSETALMLELTNKDFKVTGASQVAQTVKTLPEVQETQD